MHMHMHICCVCVSVYVWSVCVYVCVQAGRLASTLGTISVWYDKKIKPKTTNCHFCFIIPYLIGWLNLVNAKLSPKRYSQGPRSQEVGEG